MKITRLCLIRHGETNWNAERRLQGHTDTPLNEHGQAQARLMARALKNTQLEFDALYSSNLQRAIDTAHAVTELLNIPATTISELRERHFGVLQGLTITEAPLAKPEVWKAHVNRELDHDLEGGESIAVFADRVFRALEQLRQRHAGKTILVVSHGGTLDMMYRLASNQSLGSERIASVPNASLNWLEHQGESWSIEQWADTRHLDNASLENTDL
jgi:2,3-bisphosphoglycerate-dependent phosphoglycerate mutase